MSLLVYLGDVALLTVSGCCLIKNPFRINIAAILVFIWSSYVLYPYIPAELQWYYSLTVALTFIFPLYLSGIEDLMEWPATALIISQGTNINFAILFILISVSSTVLYIYKPEFRGFVIIIHAIFVAASAIGSEVQNEVYKLISICLALAVMLFIFSWNIKNHFNEKIDTGSMEDFLKFDLPGQNIALNHLRGFGETSQYSGVKSTLKSMTLKHNLTVEQQDELFWRLSSGYGLY